MPRGPRNPIDCHIGVRRRQRRNSLGISLEALGAAIGVSYQQVQKYERGSSKIAASLLHEIAYQLQAPITYIFDGIGTAKH